MAWQILFRLRGSRPIARAGTGVLPQAGTDHAAASVGIPFGQLEILPVEDGKYLLHELIMIGREEIMDIIGYENNWFDLHSLNHSINTEIKLPNSERDF